jgi:hypothetical protein
MKGLFMYYSYHAKAKQLISEGHLTGFEYLDSYNKISPCLLLYFDSHKPMPIRDYRWNEYIPLLSSVVPEDK